MGANTLDPIRHQINAGDQRGARLALAELLDAEPDNSDAWALLAILLTDPAEQAQCYREILRINPSDRQAEIWLESLTGQVTEQPTGAQPPAQEPIQPDEQLPSEDRSGFQPASDEKELDRILEDVALPDAADEVQQLARQREIPRRQVERRGFLDGLLGRMRGSTTGPDPEAEALVLGQEEAALAAGALSPELILRLAGGPLAPEERRNCPQCHAVVSRREAKCPWCSAPLSDAEGR
jgi:hypothetical protein